MTESRPSRKICFYFVATHLGGAERSVLELLKMMHAHPEHGYSALIVVPRFDGALIDEFRALGLEFDVIPMPENLLSITRKKPLASLVRGLYSTPAVSAYLYRLQRYLRERSPDLIYSTGIKCHLIAGLLSPMLSIPVLWHLRDILAPGPTLAALRTVGRIPWVSLAANSLATAASFAGSSETVRSSISVVYNGLDPDVYAPRPSRLFNGKYGLPNDMPVVGIVGVIARWKGQLEFIRMAKRLLDSGTRATFVIVGAEIYDTMGEKGFLKSLEAEVRKLGLSEQVRFTGYMSNPADAINGLDVMVHASIQAEPFGRVVVEAMACEVPVVGSRAGGVVELVEDGKTGLLFDPGNVDAMAQAVSRLLENRPLRQRLTSAAKDRFNLLFTRDHYFDGMIRVFDQALSSRGRRRRGAP